ncbi:hypothetical protein ACO0KY_08700 [Undibacterium sp. Dicai25W]|uniref:hypothetical protein n=1 Tax=Undibacterium sp. Dicai25W TaxID=3413034 RepID=UPI003BF458D3
MLQFRKITSSVAAIVVSTGLFFQSSPALSQAAPSINVVQEIKNLQITSGPYANAYLIAPAGRINWYFSNLGLLPIVQYLSPADLQTYVLSYLNLYLHNLTANSTIMDVNFVPGTNNFVLVPSDSDDSYAATFLSLAVKYVRVSQDMAWWKVNEVALKNIAYRNLAVMEKPSDGLTATFQPPRNQSNSLGYLMDNAESYRGLRDFAGLLRDLGEPVDANYYDLVATGIVGGISNYLYDTAHAGFKTSDGDAQATTAFYAGTTCQVFPQAFGLSELSSYYDKAWTYLNLYTPNWQSGQYDPFPWAVLGYVAALRNQTAMAVTQQHMIESKFITNRGLITMNELGFYQRTKSLLAGKPAI